MKRRRGRFGVGPRVFGILVLLAPSPLHAQLATNTAELAFDETRGDSLVAFEVTNDSGEAIEAAVYLGDWTRRPNGENVFSEPGTVPGSCHPRLEVFPSMLRLPPGGAQSVRVALRGDSPDDRACWSIVFVESRPAPLETGSRVAYSVRLGIKVYALPAGLRGQGEIETAEVRASDAGAEIFWRFRNAGERPLTANPTIEIRGLDNQLVSEVRPPEFPVLPGGMRESALPIPSLPAGRYVALVLIDYGGDEIAAAQADLEVR